MIERNAELEFADLATELGMGLVPWSPLAMGVLSGKCKPSQGSFTGSGQLETVRAQNPSAKPPPGFGKLTERNFRIVAELEAVAQQAGRPMAQVALNWLHHKRGVASIIVGATKPEQLRDSLAALDFTLDLALVALLDAVSEPARPVSVLHGRRRSPGPHSRPRRRAQPARCLRSARACARAEARPRPG